MKTAENGKRFWAKVRAFPWRGAAVHALGLLNLAAIAALFFVPPERIEPLKSLPWTWWPWIARAQFVPAVLALDFAIVAATVAATLLFGRVYCEAVCPLGVAQDVLRRAAFARRLRVRRVCPRLPVSRAVWAVRLSVLAAAVAAGAAGVGVFWLDPYAIFCRGLALAADLHEADVEFALLAALPLGAVAILCFVGKGRLWCNAICPAGTVFALIAKPLAGETKILKTCGACRECFPKKTEKGDDR